jgi:DNA-binding transcriptional LysR family regulator
MIPPVSLDATRFAEREHLPVREPEVAELRAFCAAATLGSIAEAARSLNVSQPALSKRLRTLEAVAGAELFERSSRGVTLTAAGATLYGAARRVLASADNVSALLHSPSLANPVRIASSPVIAEAKLPSVLADLAQLESDLVVEMIVANSALVREFVATRRCDLGIAALDPYGQPHLALQERVIWRDEVVIGVPAGHPWQAVEEIPLEEFARTPLVQRDPLSNQSRVVATALERAGVQRVRPLAEIGSSRAVVEMALATRAPALVSMLAASGQQTRGLIIRRVEGIRFDREFALVWSGPVVDLPLLVQVVVQHLLDLPFARSRRHRRKLMGG